MQKRRWDRRQRNSWDFFIHNTILCNVAGISQEGKALIALPKVTPNFSLKSITRASGIIGPEILPKQKRLERIGKAIKIMWILATLTCFIMVKSIVYAFPRKLILGSSVFIWTAP